MFVYRSYHSVPGPLRVFAIQWFARRFVDWEEGEMAQSLEMMDACSE